MRRAMSCSSMVRRVCGLTCTTSTFLMCSSEAMPSSIAVMPVVSASVSSVRLPVPISISAFGTLAPHSRIALERLHEAEIDRIEHGVGEIGAPLGVERVHGAIERVHVAVVLGDRAPGSRRPDRRCEASSSLRLSRKSAPALPPRSSSSASAESTLDLVALLLQRARSPPRDAERACRAGSRGRSRWRRAGHSPRARFTIASTDSAEASTISAKI